MPSERDDLAIMKIAKELVEKHVIYDQTLLVGALLDNYMFDWYSEVANAEVPRPQADLEEMYPDEWALWKSSTGSLSDADYDALTDEQIDVRNWWVTAQYPRDTFAYWLHFMDPDAGAMIEREINQWYVVSDWLLNKLEAKEQPILRNDYGEWWGRMGTGSPVLLDGVILEIAEEYPDAP